MKTLGNIFSMTTVTLATILAISATSTMISIVWAGVVIIEGINLYIRNTDENRY